MSHPNVFPGPDVERLLAGVRELLASNQPAKALSTVEAARVVSPWVDNARAVCLLRLARISTAIEVLRPLVFEASGLAVRSDASPVHLANYATALLLDGNTDGFFGILHGARDQAHPAIARLREAVRQWKASMTWGQWMKSFIGPSGRPLTLSFPPGEV